MSNLELLDRATSAVMCDVLQIAGPNLIGAGVWAIPSGVGALPAVALMSAGAASLLASNYLCQPMDLGGTTPVPGVDGCQTVNGYGQLEYKDATGWKAAGQSGSQTLTAQAVSILSVTTIGPDGNGLYSSECEFTTASYGTVKVPEGNTSSSAASLIEWRINPTNGTCTEEGGPGSLPTDVYTPRPFVDPVTNCTFNVTFQGFVEPVPGGLVEPVLLVEGTQIQRSTGGRMGGCNFPPVVYVPGGGGGGTIIPAPPGPVPPPIPPGGGGDPWWLEVLRNILAGVAAKVIADELQKLFEAPLPASSREIYAACEYKEDGSPETFSVNFPEESWNDRILTALDAIVDFQQQILLWKTPVCSGAPVPLTGDPVTINWISDEASVGSGTRLRKLFTYFDDSGSTLQQTVDHWRDFTWDSGPVVVSVNGVKLGKPQVWASSVDEGKRVINHAAAIAGTDMTNAEWFVSSPRSARYGQAGTMRIMRSKEGVLGITKRPGPSGFPEGLP